jgi:hypothetical protein
MQLFLTKNAEKGKKVGLYQASTNKQYRIPTVLTLPCVILMFLHFCESLSSSRITEEETT